MPAPKATQATVTDVNAGVREGVKTQALVVADDPVYLNWLQKAAGAALDFELLQSHDIDETLAKVESLRPDLMFVEFIGPMTAQRAALIERMQEAYWQVPVIGLATEENADWVLSAMRGGARDFFVLGRDDQTLPMQIGRLLRRSATHQVQRGTGNGRKGQVFPVLGGQPHEGIAFLAEHLALALTEKLATGERAILVDLSTPAGAASIFLNISPSYSVLDAIRDVYRCDETLVDTAFSRHTSGLYVLSLPEDHLARPDFDIDEMLKLIEILQGLFKAVVIAVDGHLPVEGIAGLVERADRVLLISDQSILKSRHTKHLLRVLRHENCPMERIGLVVDNYRRRLGLEPRNLAELFELPLLATLTTESYNRIVSMNSGEPLFTMARKDPFCAAVRKLAEVLLSGSTEAVAEPQGFLGRLMG